MIECSRVSMFVLVCLLSSCGRVGVLLLDAGSRSAGRDAATHDSGANVGVDSGSYAGDPCSSSCSNPHGSAQCQSGVCSLECQNGFADCDTRTENGCETDTASVADSCGRCDATCQNEHGSRSCNAGLCSPTCSPGFGDCDADPSNGCEGDLNRTQSCGSCTQTCSNEHGATECLAGMCVPSCESGFADCDGVTLNGCETDLLNDPTHCGSCTQACGTSGQICEAGACVASPCANGRGECDGDLGVTCETDLQTSTSDCGYCGKACMLDNASVSCSDGSCAIASCDAGYGDCNSSATDGCETVFASTTAHCGSCAIACTNGHGTTSCGAASCMPACAVGFGDCDGDKPNGCETGLDTVSHCGMCGRSCPTVSGGSPTCNAGVCGTQCDLTGTFAIKLTVAVTWPSESWIRNGNGSVVAWARLQGTHSGNSLTGTISDCGRTNPSFASGFLSETYRLLYPNALFDHDPTFFPGVSASVTLGSAAPGASFALARVVFLNGLSMNDPQNGSWPTSSSGVMQVDMDADGQRGVTGQYSTASGNARPPASTTNLTRRSDDSYFAARMVFALGGTLTSCTQASGSASVSQVNTRIVGCHIANASSCSTNDTMFFDSNHPQYSAGNASYSLVKVADNASCAAIRAALP